MFGFVPRSAYLAQSKRAHTVHCRVPSLCQWAPFDRVLPLSLLGRPYAGDPRAAPCMHGRRRVVLQAGHCARKCHGGMGPSREHEAAKAKTPPSRGLKFKLQAWLSWMPGSRQCYVVNVHAPAHPHARTRTRTHAPTQTHARICNTHARAHMSGCRAATFTRPPAPYPSSVMGTLGTATL